LLAQRFTLRGVKALEAADATDVVAIAHELSRGELDERCGRGRKRCGDF
jgi:hypothetical protein